MNWILNNKFLAGLLGVVLLGSIVLLVLLVMAIGKYNEVSSSYDKSQRELDRLKGAKVFPSEVNVRALEEQREDYGKQLVSLRENLAAVEFPLDDVSPTAFQDRLRAEVSAIQQLAAEKNVELPQDFYLGFGQYQTELPSAEAAPLLDRQLDSIKLIAQRLMDFGITRLDFIDRNPLPVETGATAEESEEEQKPLINKEILNIGFLSSEAVLQDIMNAIVGAESFLVLRTLSVQNEEQQGPAKSEMQQTSTRPADTNQDQFAALFAEDTESGEDAPTQPEERLQFLVGQEKVNVTMKIEILDFVEPDTGNSEE